MVSARLGTVSLGANEYRVPDTIKAWVLGGPEELSLVDKPVPQPGPAEVPVRIDAIAVCATDIEILKHGLPAMINGELPFNKAFTPGHEYMGRSRISCATTSTSSASAARATARPTAPPP